MFQIGNFELMYSADDADNNPFTDLGYFSEMGTSRKMKWIHLESYGSNEVYCDARWLLKLLTEELLYLCTLGVR